MAPIVVETGVDALGGRCHGAVDAAGELIARHRQPVAGALLPRRQQRVGKQRQHAVATRPQVAEQDLDEAGLQLEPGGTGGAGDGLDEFRVAHRVDHELVVLHGFEQFGISEAAAVEVGSHAQHDQGGTRPVAQCGDEVAALGFVGAEREDLLELVHHDDQPGAARPQRRPQRAPPVPAAHAVGQLGHVGAEELRRPFAQRADGIRGGRHHQHRP